MSSENCLSSGNIDRPLITRAHHTQPHATLNSSAHPRDTEDGEGAAEKLGGPQLPQISQLT